jgi:HlyD family secretion protein
VKAGRIILGIIIFVLVLGLGYLGYQRFLAPLPEESASQPTAQAAGPPAAAAARSGTEVASAEGTIVPVRYAELAFRTSDRVAEVLVASGDAVEAGEALARLENDDLRAAIAQAEAAIVVAEAQLALAKVGPRPEAVAVAEAQIDAAEAALAQAAAQRNQLLAGAIEAEIAAAESDLAAAELGRKAAEDQYDQLKGKVHGWIEEESILQLHAAEQALTAAHARLAQAEDSAWPQKQSANAAVLVAEAQQNIAQAQLALAKVCPLSEEVEVAEASVRQAEAALEAAQVALAETELKAPFAGTVADVTLEVGETVLPGAPVIIVADFSPWRVETDDLSELNVVHVQLGQEVEVRVDALPDQVFHGRVTEVPLVSELKQGDVTYAVVIELDDVGDAPLRWGMKVFVDIHTGD